MSKRTSKNNISKPFNVYAGGAKSFTTNSCSSKTKRFIADVVNYSLSVDELKSCPSTIEQPMRDADPGELKILYNSADGSSGKNYLTKRLDRSPRQKYYFPEATSWRIGWIQKSIAM